MKDTVVVALIVFVALVVFASCDTSDAPPTAPAIIGPWHEVESGAKGAFIREIEIGGRMCVMALFRVSVAIWCEGQAL